MITGLYFFKRLCSVLSYWSSDEDSKAAQSDRSILRDS
jgi:hypothetical protein